MTIIIVRCYDCGDVKRRQVRSTESAGASEVLWTEQEYHVEPSCRPGRQTRLTLLAGDAGASPAGIYHSRDGIEYRLSKPYNTRTPKLFLFISLPRSGKEKNTACGKGKDLPVYSKENHPLWNIFCNFRTPPRFRLFSSIFREHAVRAGNKPTQRKQSPHAVRAGNKPAQRKPKARTK